LAAAPVPLSPRGRLLEGKRVAVVDRKYIGGYCPNIACLPSKNIIHSGEPEGRAAVAE
jgi:pyruvate/2-oxoglutarate dehydrogenase complex dihydrolipoamide dehydrogenase (E3) component